MKALVLGGAGYIGSHMVHLLNTKGHDVTVFDNLSTGHRDAVRTTEFVAGDIRDDVALLELFAEFGPFDVVYHFCAKSVVAESVEDPSIYYSNNVLGTINVLEAMRRYGAKKLVFSSTAAVYGNPAYTPIDEVHSCQPINPYGATKLVIEGALGQYHRAYGIDSISFRYFNAAGANATENLGERHDPETHLIPSILRSVLGGKTELTIFGGDYDTDDGSCVRDYIHVEDLCTAHLLGAEFLSENSGSQVFNLGNGVGFSVFQVLSTVESVIGQRVPFRVGPRRDGDPPMLVADAAQARRVLCWNPVHEDIKSIVESAWDFHRQQHRQPDNDNG